MLHLTPWKGCGYSFTEELFSLSSAPEDPTLAQSEVSALVDVSQERETTSPDCSTLTQRLLDEG